MRLLFAAGHLDPVGGRVTAGGAPPSSPGSEERGPSGWRPGRATQPRASDRRKLIRLADELVGVVVCPRLSVPLLDMEFLLEASQVLGRMADELDVPENTEESCR